MPGSFIPRDKPRRTFGTVLVAMACVGVGIVAFASSCAPARVPCSAASPCREQGEEGSCIAGRCVTVGELPARNSARTVIKPVAVAWVGRGVSEREPTAQLGGVHGGRLLLRFALPNSLDRPPPSGERRTSTSRLVAAHLVLNPLDLRPPLSEEAEENKVDTLWLRADRIVDPWEEASVTWANQPRTFDVGSAPTRIGTRRPRIRLDVLELVKRWARHDPTDQGVAVEAEGSPPVVVALSAIAPEATQGLGVSGPELELYFSGNAREDSSGTPVQR